MIFFHWSGARSGAVSWLISIIIAFFFFGLNFQVFWVSQVKGFLLSIFVLAVLWPALLLYNLINQVGGIKAIARGLEFIICDRNLLVVILAWAFSGMLEGMAGFGIPIAVVAPMLVELGISPLIAIAAVAVGHGWSVTFGDMGIIFQTLIGVSNMDGSVLAPFSAILLGVACVFCGLSVAWLLGQIKLWRQIILIGLLMSTTQYFLAVGSLFSLGALGAGAIGILSGIFLSKRTRSTPSSTAKAPNINKASLITSILSYGGLALLMTLLNVIPPLQKFLYTFKWQLAFPSVQTATGFNTPISSGPTFLFFLHPGTSISFIFILSLLILNKYRILPSGQWKTILKKTSQSATPASLVIFATMGLSSIMEYCGMTQLLALGLSSIFQTAFPIVSPLIGLLGAFATGSNNNSNVLFVPLQKSAAQLLNINPALLMATQTTGGSLGSMIAPAKIIIGCSTVGLLGKEGEIIRKTLFYGLLLSLLIGLIAFVWTLF